MQYACTAEPYSNGEAVEAFTSGANAMGDTKP